MGLVDRARAQAGADARLVVSGCGGAGKTTLLDALAARWHDDGRAAVRVVGRRLEGDRPGWALDAVLGPALVAGLAESGATAERLALDALLELAGTGAVLVVDDAHWLDPCSLRLVAGAAERGAAVVVATRPTERADVAALVSILGAGNRLLPLAPLDAAEVACLAAGASGGAADAGVVARLLERTAGIPGWVVAALAPVDVLVVRVSAELDQLPDAARHVVTAAAAGAAAVDGLLATVVGLPPGVVATAVDQARAAGLVHPDGAEPVGVVADVLILLHSGPEGHDLQARVASAAVGLPGRAKVARRLVAAGATGDAVARLLVAAAEEVAGDDPAMASTWLDRAVTIGADPGPLGVRRAELAARRGDLASALRLVASSAPAAGDGGGGAGLVITAGALAARGLWEQAASRYVALLDGHEPVRALLAVPLLVAGGDLERAHEVADAVPVPSSPSSSLLAAILSGCASGMLATVHRPAEALDALLAAAEMAEADPLQLLLPESPHALAVLVASASGDLVVADQLATRAVEAGIGGASLAVRHRLLVAWMAMRSGRWTEAEEVLAATEAVSRRDLLVAVALAAALARRAGDVGRLAAAWDRAQPLLLGWNAELGLLEPVGELAVAAARLGQWERIAPIARDLGGVLDRLGRPPLWDLHLRWYGLHAAIAADDGPAAARRAEDLARIEPASARLAPLGTIARVWAATLGGRADPSALAWAASELQGLGLAWEGSRLLGAGAIRTTDAAATRSLLEQARGLRDELGTSPAAALADVSALSEREAQVAEGVADGLTHKEIGERLYISPKTVEHHVARIRQKLGASTRAEMLAALRK